MAQQQQQAYIVPALTGFATLLIGIGMGRYGYPPLIPALINQEWFTVSQADYLGAANLTGYILGSVCGAHFSRYVPAVTLIKTSLFVTALTFVGCAYPLAFPLYFLLRFTAGVTGGMLMVNTAPMLFKFTPTNKKGTVGGFIFAGVGMGMALAGTLIPLLVAKSLFITWMAFTATALVLIVLTWKGWPAGSNEKHVKSSISIHGRKNPLWTKPVFLLLISYACNSVGFVPHTVFWVDFISRGLGQGIASGTHYWVLLGLSAAVGPLLSGYIADKMGFARSIRLSLLVKSVGVILPLLSTASWSLAFSSICVGSLALGIVSLAAGRTAELVEPVYQKSVWSAMTITYSVSHALTAYLLTYLFSVYHSFYMLFVIGAITLLIGSLTDYLSSRSAAKL